jgi:hypothetical protein
MLLFFLPAVTLADPLGVLIKGESFWADGTGETFMQEHGALGFQWTSEAKDSARSINSGLTVEGRKVGESIVYFVDDKPTLVQISIHNRGDDGVMSGRDGREKFNETIRDWAAFLDEVTGVEMENRGKDSKSAVKADGVMWTLPDRAYLLEYSSSGRTDDFQSQFIRLRVAPVVVKSLIEEQLDGQKKGPVAKASLPDNLVKEDGAVFIDNIPMVDQGGKGYCVVATASRVFSYYGLQVTMHELAQLSGADPNKGTSVEEMVEEIGRLAGRFKTRVKAHEEMDYGDMEDLTKDYNRAAKRMDKSEVPDGAGANQWYNFDKFDPEVLREARLKSKSGISKFEREVKRTIDAGIPLLWTVTVGIYEEPKRISQSRGGHMRLIIGYDDRQQEIVFSDSWGAGHEQKRLGLEEAYCMTKGIYSIQPIK